MKFTVALGTYEVTMVDDFKDIPDAWKAGQHWQVPGFILVDVDCGSSTNIHLLHPETDGVITGHSDIVVCVREELSFKRSNGQNLTLREHYFDQLWPTGLRCLLNVIIVVEQELGKMHWYVPKLWDWMAKNPESVPHE